MELSREAKFALLNALWFDNFGECPREWVEALPRFCVAMIEPGEDDRARFSLTDEGWALAEKVAETDAAT